MKYVTTVGFGSYMKNLESLDRLIEDTQDTETAEAYHELMVRMIENQTGFMSTLCNSDRPTIDTDGLVPLSKVSSLDVPLGFYGVVNQYGDHFVVTHTETKGCIDRVEALICDESSLLNGMQVSSWDVNKLWLDGRMYGLHLAHENVDHLSAFVQDEWPEEKRCHQPE